MGRLEDTLRQEEARRREAEALEGRAAEVAGKEARAKVTALAKALKRERRILNRYRAEVATGHCMQTLKRVRTGEGPDGSDTYRDDRLDTDLWVCAIRWPGADDDDAWTKKMDITFAGGIYCLLEAKLIPNTEPGGFSDDPNRFIRRGGTQGRYGIELKPVGTGIGDVLDKIAKEFSGTDSDNLYAFSALTIAKPRTIVCQGTFRRKWDL